MTAGLIRSDAVIVGGGLAGLMAALHLPSEWDVLVVDKASSPESGSSPWAQGGMAIAVHPDDSPELHAADTVRAGAGACREEAVQVLVDEAHGALEELVALGCAFDKADDGGLDLNREGGQAVARSVHAADATGREIMRVVGAKARERARRLVAIATRLLVDDGRCNGVRVVTEQGEVDVVGRAIFLGTGGCGALYEATTNPVTATGDGIALAWEAGAAVEDVEFVQFHPTALAAGGLRRVLLTEALRGEGAIVVDKTGERFLFEAHPDGELGPRDVVARAIADRGGAFLDACGLGAERVKRRFPNIYAAVAEAGFDMTMEPVPIMPAAHYFLGGVATDVFGRTSLPGLYAAGECAATGVHGANRMAGNSLTEAVVFGRRAAIAMADEAPADAPSPPHDEDDELPVRVIRPDEWDRLREAMSVGTGLLRTKASLVEAAAVADDVAIGASDELRAAAVAAGLICRGARLREESRGVHFRSDHPERSTDWDGRHVTLRPSVE